MEFTFRSFVQQIILITNLANGYIFQFLRPNEKTRSIIHRSIEYVDINDDGIRDWMKRLVSAPELDYSSSSLVSWQVHRLLDSLWMTPPAETNTIENAIPFDRFYPVLSARYNLKARRGISSYNHDRLRFLSLK